MAGDWKPDVLGEPFEQMTLELGIEDDTGPLVATLVRSIPNPVMSWAKPLRDVDVLYVHGWSDFFFQVELARFWNGLGARFHALDLRRYGRSLRPGQVAGFIDSLDEYDADIEAALVAMGHGTDASSSRRLVLLGHSTGGLVLTLWADRHRGRASALVLNSPWLELQLGAIARQAIAPLVNARARLDPRGTQPAVDLGFYTRRRGRSVHCRSRSTSPSGGRSAASRPGPHGSRRSWTATGASRAASTSAARRWSCCRPGRRRRSHGTRR